RMSEDVVKVVGSETVIQRHKDRANLRHAKKAFQHPVRIRRKDGDTVALTHAQGQKRMAQTVGALPQLSVGELLGIVDDGQLGGKIPFRPPEKVVWSKRLKHQTSGFRPQTSDLRLQTEL